MTERSAADALDEELRTLLDVRNYHKARAKGEFIRPLSSDMEAGIVFLIHKRKMAAYVEIDVFVRHLGLGRLSLRLRGEPDSQTSLPRSWSKRLDMLASPRQGKRYWCDSPESVVGLSTEIAADLDGPGETFVGNHSTLKLLAEEYERSRLPAQLAESLYLLGDHAGAATVAASAVLVGPGAVRPRWPENFRDLLAERRREECG